jgi:aspartate carbamoyltransferase catalytic subunit
VLTAWYDDPTVHGKAVIMHPLPPDRFAQVRDVIDKQNFPPFE